MSDGAIVIRITTEGPKARIAIEVPESVKAALKMASLKEDRTQSELATEALLRFLTAPIGTFSPQVSSPGKRPKEYLE
jgi:hypothetical protein